jgi:hypothetical protein
MKTATGLTLVAIGAILAFAVKAHPSFLNLQVAGWVIIAVGIAGFFVPQRGYGWLRRRVIVRRGNRPVTRVEETRDHSYVELNPGEIGDGDPRITDPPPPPARPATRSEILSPPQTETVEEYFEE